MQEQQETDTSLNGKPAIMTRQRAEAELSAKVRIILGAMLAGIVSSFPGAPPMLVMPIVAKHMGTLLAASVRGDMATMLALRKALKDGFGEGVASVDLASTVVKPPADIRRP